LVINIWDFLAKKKIKKNNYLGNIINAFDYIIKNEVDEIYCSLSVLTNAQIKKFIKFSDDNFKTLKFIPKRRKPVNKRTQRRIL